MVNSFPHKFPCLKGYRLFLFVVYKEVSIEILFSDKYNYINKIYKNNFGQNKIFTNKNFFDFIYKILMRVSNILYKNDFFFGRLFLP